MGNKHSEPRHRADTVQAARGGTPVDSRVEETERRTRGSLRQPAAAGQRTREEKAAEKARYLERAPWILMSTYYRERVIPEKALSESTGGNSSQCSHRRRFPSPGLEIL